MDHDLAYHCAGSGEPDPCCKDCQDPCEYICDRAMRKLDEAQAEDEEDEPQETENSDLELLREMLEKENNKLSKMREIGEVTDPFIAMLDKKQKLLVDALTALISSMERQTLSEEEERQEQPELPALKNNDQRKRFLETFREWPVWFEVPQAAEVYYRYDLPDGCSLVICEYHYWASWKVKYGYGGEPECTGTREYLLTPEYHYLEDCKISRTAMIEKLKEIQKGGKERECRD